LSSAFRFAHLSDWHATTLVGGGRALWRGKRISGYASWALNRRRHHDPRILEAAIRDVRAQAVDRVLVTGDLTHVSLESEFIKASEQLATLGAPKDVFLIPGNHDCYVPADPARSWDHWAGYLRGDSRESVESQLGPLGDSLISVAEDARAPAYAEYPTIRLAGHVATIGLCSSIPTPIFRAGGLLGPDQLARLEALLSALDAKGYFRVVMIHHPVAAKGEPARRALWDGDELRGVLARVGAELVLHGHKHRRRMNRVPGPRGEVPIVGVPSSSEVGSKPGKSAQYHLYSVTGEGAQRRLTAEVRAYDAASGEFLSVDDDLFA